MPISCCTCSEPLRCGQGIARTRVAVCDHFAGQQFAIDQHTIAIPEDRLKHHIASLTIGTLLRAGTTTSRAATIMFLASPDNRVARGAVVPVYGKA